jgi:hypothetical protein
MFDDLTKAGLRIATPPTTCSRVLADLVRQAPTGHFTLGWVLSKLHQRSFGVVLLFLGVLATAPIGSSLPGIALAVVAIQMMVGFSEPVIPRFVTERKFPTPHFVRFGLRAVPILRQFEKIVYPRWPFAFHLAKDLTAIVVLLPKRRIAYHTHPFQQHPSCGSDRSHRPRLYPGGRVASKLLGCVRVRRGRNRVRSSLGGNRRYHRVAV